MVDLLVVISCKFLGLGSEKDCHLEWERKTFINKRNLFGSGFPKLKASTIEIYHPLISKLFWATPIAINLKLEKVGNVAVETNVHEALSDNSKTVTQPLENAQSHLIHVGRFTP